MKNINSQEDKIIQELQREAEATRPDFSEQLHSRICDALADEPERPEPASRLTRRRGRFVRAAAAIAGAAVAIAIAWFAVTRGLDPGTTPGPDNTPIVENPVNPVPDKPDTPAPTTPDAEAEALAALQGLMASTTEAPGTLGSEMTNLLASDERALDLEQLRIDGRGLLEQIPGFGP